RPRDKPAFVPRRRGNVDRNRGPGTRLHHMRHPHAFDIEDQRAPLQPCQVARGDPALPGTHRGIATAVGLEWARRYGRSTILVGIHHDQNGMNSMRAAIYARYSSDLQRDASIEDQIRACRSLIDSEDWDLAATYTDHAISG